MGLSSNARLLSLTARLTSNEYEAQKIANAKMRLATQSQDISRDYINALNTQKLMFMTYDAQGNAITSDLTAGFLYQYSDSKNQYILSNIAGQVLLKDEDRTKFESARNLEEFLKSYGIEKTWKTEKLALASEKMDSYAVYKNKWEDILNKYKNKEYQKVKFNTGELTTNEDTSEEGSYDEYGYRETYKDGYVYGEYEKLSAEDAWECEKTGAYNDWVFAYNDYQDKISDYEADGTKYYTTTSKEEITETTEIGDINTAYNNQNKYYNKYTSYVTFDSWIEMKAKADNDTEYKNYLLYKDAAAEFNAEAEKFETVNDTYSYDDSPKAQWYTNLWYRLNGESSEKSTAGELASNYQLLDSNLLTSSTWLQDALAQGTITLESAVYKSTPDEIPDFDYPNVVNLKGITWASKTYSTCVDITTVDDKAAIAKAEAEYEQKTQEITAKEKKFQDELRKLETEHDAIKTEYESVQKALEGNISRSYKTFNS